MAVSSTTTGCSDELAQFDIYRLRDGRHLVDLQTDLIDMQASRLVAPMVRLTSRLNVSTLTPLIRHDDRDWLAIVPQMAGIPARGLGGVVGNAAEHSDELFLANDLLTHGF